MFVINVPNFNMFAIEKTNQGSRWRRGYGSVYIIIDGHDVLKVKQNGDNLLMDCSEQEFFDKWYKYFDVGANYDVNNERLSNSSQVLAKCIEICDGFRLIKRKPYEIMLSLIIDDDVKFDTVCKLCGKKHKNAFGDSGVVTWHELPDYNDLLWNKRIVEMVLGKEKASKVIAFANDVKEQWIDFDTFEMLKSNPEYFSYLDKYQIDEVLALSGIESNNFPRSPKVSKLIELWYDVDTDTFIEWYLSDVDDLLNVAYMYMKSAIELRGLKRKWD